MSAAAQSAPLDVWAEAGRAFRERFPLPRLGTPEGDAVAWSFANVLAGHDDASRARCMVAMGLRRVATLARSEVAWWQPDWFRVGLGMSRDMAAQLNRSMRDSRVFLMKDAAKDAPVIPPPDLLLAVDVDAGGEWRTCSGGAFGEDWISLGAFCWRTTRGQAAARIARICGYGRLPRVGDLR